MPEHWGGGVAGRLHDEALGRIAAAACGRQLDVMVDNARARRFYERRGWVPDGRGASPFPPTRRSWVSPRPRLSEAPPHATIEV